MVADRIADWHARTIESALRDLETSPEGLTQAEADGRLKVHGANRLPAARKHSVVVRLLLQFHNILIYVLIGSAAIAAFLQHLVDTLVILAVVIANALIGFLQEGKAEKAMDAIRLMLAPHANVLRGGERRSVEGEALVPGDIVLLEAGRQGSGRFAVAFGARHERTGGHSHRRIRAGGEASRSGAGRCSLGRPLEHGIQRYAGCQRTRPGGGGCSRRRHGNRAHQRTSVDRRGTHQPAGEADGRVAKWLTVLILLIAAGRRGDRTRGRRRYAAGRCGAVRHGGGARFAGGTAVRLRMRPERTAGVPIAVTPPG